MALTASQVAALNSLYARTGYSDAATLGVHASTLGALVRKGLVRRSTEMGAVHGWSAQSYKITAEGTLTVYRLRH